MSLKNTFAAIGVGSPMLPVLSELGYETPTPIQAQSIPVLLSGRDLLAQAQTGTGKTAAFALPILTNIDLKQTDPQALVLAPTRELAIQVADSFQSYAKAIKGFHVLSIYGGHGYREQLKALKRGVHVVVGTPGRIMDHLRRGSLCIEHLKTVVLDEADEMLKMGFIDDVEWILEQIKSEHQIALFSATIPGPIKRAANKYLKNPEEVRIKSTGATVDAIEQSYMIVNNHNKIEALTRFLEMEEFDAVLVFTRTKISTEEVANKLLSRGYAVSAMNGDMNQVAREKVIKCIKQKSLDIIIATEVAARGLDIDRISHVINYDMPADPDTYIHRIGRTGRAGREGKSLLFVTPRERRMLQDIEHMTKKTIKLIDPPSLSDINKKRTDSFKEQVLSVLGNKDLSASRVIVENIMHDGEYDELDVAAALVVMAQKQKPINEDKQDSLSVTDSRDNYERKKSRNRDDENMVCCRVEVGRSHGLEPGEIVRVLSEKGNIRSASIGKIRLCDDYSLVDIAADVVDQVIKLAQRVKLKNISADIKRASESDSRKANERSPRRFQEKRSQRSDSRRTDERPKRRFQERDSQRSDSKRSDERPKRRFQEKDSQKSDSKRSDERPKRRFQEKDSQKSDGKRSDERPKRSSQEKRSFSSKKRKRSS